MDAPSYRHLAQVYDELFPLDPDALSLVLETRREPTGRIVDAGCGTGLMVRALADAGIRAHGFDLDADLLAVATTKEGRGATFSRDDLRSFSLPGDFGNPEAVLCLGNSVPHLTDPLALDAFFSRASAVLVPGGRLLLQVLDYDWLESQGILTLPERRVGGWVFTRRYEVLTSGSWRFHTTLEGEGVLTSGSFPLRPWRRAELETHLARAGFRVEGVWGGFDQRVPGNSLPLVVSARLE